MILYLGMDFEGSGSNPWEKHVPVQIGITTGTAHFEALIGGWKWSEWVWDEKAASVHNIPRETIDSADPVWKVDIYAANWLLSNGWRNRMFTVPVGFNVAGYDRQFVTRWMPNLNRLLSYRSVDLNSLVFSRAGTNEEKYNGIKMAAKKYAQEQLRDDGEEAKHHDGLYDAKLALAAFDFLRVGGVIDGVS